MSSSLALTALLMGVAGGPHCLAMCGAACAGLGQAAGQRPHAALGSFQVGRLLGYSALGALAAGSVQALGWLTTQSAAVRPLWSLLHVAAVVLGLWLLATGRQPLALERPARALWQRVRGFAQSRPRSAPGLIGLLWALMPCGLLYSALMVAALSGSPGQGALTMALFALGSGVGLWAGPWLFLRLQTLGDGSWGMRAAGLALAGVSAWGLWLGLVHNQAPWCVVPA